MGEKHDPGSSFELALEAGRQIVRLDAAADIAVARFGAAPAAAVAAARPGRLGLGAAGRLWASPEAPSCGPGTLFDLASLTKPLVSLTLARLERAELLSRREPLAELLPEAENTPSASLPLDLFVAHRAGLEAHLRLWEDAALCAIGLPGERGEGPDATLDRGAALARCASARRQGCEGAPPREGFPVVYSDLGYILVGAALEARTGLPLDELVAREVALPLGLRIGSARRLRASEPERFARELAPTEDVPFRGGVLRGIVHDENAWVLAGKGTAGHAGLFGDAPSVALLGAAVLESLEGRRPEFLSPSELAPLVEPRPGGSHRAGFDGRSADSPSSGARFGPRTFGHLGFTGTSLWIDPDAGLSGVLLTNRVHPSRAHLAIRAARPAVYDAIFEAMVGPFEAGAAAGAEV